jgi:myo-inositol-1(or 4)-monophosphatase
MTMAEELLPVALEAAGVASELMRTRVPEVLTAKGDRDMATEVDYAIERAVRDFLQARSPDIAMLGEEEGISGDPEAELLWVLDPIDGTANYVRGIPLCGVSLGLMQAGRPLVGVIDLPFLETRYHAAQGVGAYAGDRRLRVSGTSDLRDAVVALGDYAVDEDADDQNRLQLALTKQLVTNVQRVRMFGSAALDLAWVADGKVDALIMLSNKPWDTSAGVIIAREAGARVIDAAGDDHTFTSTATIATTPALEPHIIELIKRAWLDPAG